MARPKKKGLEYFPLDVDILSDIKVRRLLKKDGAEAVAVYLQLLAEVYKQGYWLKVNEDTAFLVSEQVRMEEEDVTRIICDGIQLGLFDADIYESDGVLTSHGIQERYANICKLCGRSCDIDEYISEVDSFPEENPTDEDVSSKKPLVSSRKPLVSSKKPLVSSKKPLVSSPESTQSKVNNNKLLYTPPPPNARTCESEAEQQEHWYVDLTNDQSFAETVAMNMKITPDTVPRLLDVFYSETTAKKTMHNSETDFRSHAYDWIRLHVEINNDKKRRNGTTNRTGGASSTYEERREGVEQLLRDLGSRPKPH